jgi:NAD(P)-dependent dehydrogenase (short-subunit alcohol dehydrogenase family)
MGTTITTRALVTGGASGIGLAATVALAAGATINSESALAGKPTFAYSVRK